VGLTQSGLSVRVRPVEPTMVPSGDACTTVLVSMSLLPVQSSTSSICSRARGQRGGGRFWWPGRLLERGASPWGGHLVWSVALGHLSVARAVIHTQRSLLALQNLPGSTPVSKMAISTPAVGGGKAPSGRVADKSYA
jgi:hypothetical protein